MLILSDTAEDMRILVIEDERKVAEFVARGLRDQRFAVDVVNDGQAGWEMASTCNYDLVVLDLMLPGLNGIEVLKRIRRRGSQVPVLVLTARAGTAEKVENFEAGADDYLTKPFAFDELLVRVKALLRRGSTDRSSVLRIADLEMDRQKIAGQAGRKTDRAYAQGVQPAGISFRERGQSPVPDDDHRTRLGREFSRTHQYCGCLCAPFAQQSG